jgi:hypothetical protein
MTTNSALYGKAVISLLGANGHSLALCSDGTVAAWGGNVFGHLGDNTTSDRHIPVAVNTTAGISALYSKTVASIGIDVDSSLALCSDGTLTAWGNNYDGQLGDTTTTDRQAPVKVNTSLLAPGERFTRVANSPIAAFTLALVAGPEVSGISLTTTQALTNGSLQLAFTSTPGASFTVLTTADPTLPLSAWTPVAGVTEVSPGHYQFTDSQATNSPKRFYRVRSP